MAFAEVGAGTQRANSGANHNVASKALAFPGNVSAGTLLVVAGAWFGASASPTGVLVTGGGATWVTTLAGSINQRILFISFGSGHGAGALTVTVTPSGTDPLFDGSFSIDEFSGQNLNPLDVDGGSTDGAAGTGAGTASDTITTRAANDLLVGIMTYDVGDRTLSGAAGYTIFGQTATNTSNQAHAAVFRIVTTPASYTVGVNYSSGSFTANPGWTMQALAFKPVDVARNCLWNFRNLAVKRAAYW